MRVKKIEYSLDHLTKRTPKNFLKWFTLVKMYNLKRVNNE
jgi:hypothetical protein